MLIFISSERQKQLERAQEKEKEKLANFKEDVSLEESILEISVVNFLCSLFL